MNEVKGHFATGFAAGATVVSWLPAIETMLRIGVSVAGIAAGIYATLYWRAKRQRLERKAQGEETTL